MLWIYSYENLSIFNLAFISIIIFFVSTLIPPSATVCLILVKYCLQRPDPFGISCHYKSQYSYDRVGVVPPSLSAFRLLQVFEFCLNVSRMIFESTLCWIVPPIYHKKVSVPSAWTYWQCYSSTSNRTQFHVLCIKMSSWNMWKVW